MSTSAPQTVRKARFRWYQLYFALATFDLLTIGFGLYLNHRLLAIHAGSVAEDQVWADRLHRFSEIERFVAKVGQPGDDVFATHQPAEEAARMNAAATELAAALSEAEAELIPAVGGAAAVRFRASFVNLRAGIDRVRENGARIFSTFERGDRDAAGAHMAAMDRDLGVVDGEIAGIEDQIRNIQTAHFQREFALAHSLQRFEVVLAGAMVLIIGAATTFGHKMAATMRENDEEQAQHVVSLREAHDELERRVAERTRELFTMNSSLQLEAEERRRTVRALEETQGQMLDLARHAGMAEIATGVLHNVGNVLNSVNVSASLIEEKVRNSKAPKVAKAAALLSENHARLTAYLTEDPQGMKLPGYFAKLGEHLATENAEIHGEITQLVKNVEHIKEIVAMQQSYAKVGGVTEDLPIDQVVEDAIAMNDGAFERHGVIVERDFHPAPPARIDRHKVLQILINLIRNAKHALDEVSRPDKRLRITIAPGGNDKVCLEVSDNGIGIAPENLNRIFAQGFTTKTHGHGFGLHSGANAAREIGGNLSAASAGHGLGATFTLELPAAPALAHA